MVIESIVWTLVWIALGLLGVATVLAVVGLIIMIIKTTIEFWKD